MLRGFATLGGDDLMSAINFVVLLVAATISGAFLLVFAAHIFVTIAQQTAGGLDEIAWPKDPWYDWIGKALHLGWLVAFWLVPLGLILRVIGPQTLAASAALYVGVPAALFWLLFPITLLSSFSAGSPWVLLRPEALRRMARCPSDTFGFYLATALLCPAGGAALYFTLADERFYALPVLATVLFLYARLIGRYSRLLGRVRLKGGEPKADREARRAAKGAKVEDPWGTPAKETKKERPKKKKKKPAPAAHDPWAIPEKEAKGETEQTEEAETYGIAKDEAAPKREKSQEPPLVEGYEVSSEESPSAPKEVPLDGAPPVELSRVKAEREKPLPARPLVDGVFAFPWYPGNIAMWALLTLLFLGWGLIYSVMQGAADVLK
jgi:hypothetical protein